MVKKKPRTPNSQIRSALRRLWLRSRERAQALKDAEYSCLNCGVKQSKAKGREVKVEVHHERGILNWEELENTVREYLLCDPMYLEVLCKDCHDKETKGMNK